MVYAVRVLQVTDVVVCGHSDCGAMKAVLNPENLPSLPATAAWLRHSEALGNGTHLHNKSTSESDLLAVTERNVLIQLDHLRTHSAVLEKLAVGKLELHGWYYNIGTGDITTFDPNLGRFIPLEEAIYSGQTRVAGAA